LIQVAYCEDMDSQTYGLGFGPPVVLHLYTTLFTIILVEKKTSGETKIKQAS